MADSSTNTASKRKADPTFPDSLRLEGEQSQKKQKETHQNAAIQFPDTSTLATAKLLPHSMLAIRWDASSIANDAQIISIEVATRVPNIRLLLYNLFSLKDEGVVIGDLDIFVAKVSKDFGDTISTFKYDGSDETPIKELKGIRYMRDVVNLEDSDLLLIARPKNPDPWGLKRVIYRDPIPFAEGGEYPWGGKYPWEFETSLPVLLEEQLKEPLLKHIQCFHRREKNVVPIYSFASGVGTGVSRNAQEFLNNCIASTSTFTSRAEKEILERAKVFHICLGESPNLKENYFGSRKQSYWRETEKNKPYDPDLEGTNVDTIIAARMIQQLSPEGVSLVSIYQRGKIPSTLHILKAICQSEGKQFETDSWAAVIAVDGLEFLVPADGDDSLLQTFLKHLSTMTLAGSLLLVCVTGHTYTPLIEFAKSSGQKVVNLPISRVMEPSLPEDWDRIPIFDESDQLVELLVEDCGGHGSTVETLSLVILQSMGKSSWDLTAEILPLRFVTPKLGLELVGYTNRIKRTYGQTFNLKSFHRKDLLGILRLTISRRSFTVTQPMPGTGLMLDSILKRGPFNFVKDTGKDSPSTSGYIEVPYMWVSAVLDALQAVDEGFDDQDFYLRRFHSLFDYHNIMSIQDDYTSLLFAEGEEISIAELHAGARINDSGGRGRFINRHLTFDETEIHPSPESTEPIFSNTGRAGHFNAPAGRFFLMLEKTDKTTDPAGKLISSKFCEVGFCKIPLALPADRTTDATTIRPIFDREKEGFPLATGQESLIMFYTPDEIYDTEIELGPMEGLVDGSRWDAYFGPFASRARLLYGQR